MILYNSYNLSQLATPFSHYYFLKTKYFKQCIYVWLPNGLVFETVALASFLKIKITVKL